MKLLQRLRRWWYHSILATRPTGVLAQKNAVIRSLHLSLSECRAREWRGRRDLAESLEQNARLRAMARLDEPRASPELPPVAGSYLVWLAGGRQWHEAHWTADGWRVLCNRRSPVIHWRRMPAGPADGVL